MMKEIDTLSRHSDLLIHQYIATALLMRCRDIQTRLFAYHCHVFYNCSNPCHVIALSRALISTSSSIPNPPIVHHYSICFLQSSSLLHLLTNNLPTSNLFISSEQVTWISFDSILPSFSSFLSPWPGRTTNNFYYHIAFFFRPIYLYATQHNT